MNPIATAVLAELLTLTVAGLIVLVIEGRILPRFSRSFVLSFAVTFVPSGIRHFPCAPQYRPSIVLRQYQQESVAPLQHVIGHGPHCPACNATRDELMRPSVLGELPLKEAVARWLDDKKIFIQPRTYKDYQQYFTTVNAFMGEAIVKQIHVGLVVEYQKHRLSQGVGALRINHEVLALSQLLRAAKRWDNYVRPYYKRLPESNVSRGTAITQEEAERLFKVAHGNAYWVVALHASIISVNTTAGPGELRHLKIADIDLQKREIFVRRMVKNRWRERRLPLNDDALRSAAFLLRRAYENGCCEKEHYFLPGRSKVKGIQYDPTKPQGGWHKSWRKMREAAGLPGLRQYDLRHTAITWGLADPTVSDETVKDMAGWVDPRMIRVYSHQKMEGKRRFAEALQKVQLNLNIGEPKKPSVTATYTWQMANKIVSS